MVTMLTKLFAEFFICDPLLTWARETGAVIRLRDIHPQDFCTALVGCAIGDEERSIASARRLFFTISGRMPEESSFFDRFTKPMCSLMQRIFQRALDGVTSEQREVLAQALGGTGIVNILATDASQVMLPNAASGVLPSTSDAHGGFKLTATLSLLFQQIQSVTVTDARTHDRKALKLDRWLHGVLYVFDRAYCDYRLFDTIARRKGFFLTRLKKRRRPPSPRSAAAWDKLMSAHAGARTCRFVVWSTSTLPFDFAAEHETCVSFA